MIDHPAVHRMVPRGQQTELVNASIRSVDVMTPPPLAQGSQMAFVATFLGRTLSYTHEVVELVAGEHLRMRTAQGPFPMETTYTWTSLAPGETRMTLRNARERQVASPHSQRRCSPHRCGGPFRRTWLRSNESSSGEHRQSGDRRRSDCRNSEARMAFWTAGQALPRVEPRSALKAPWFERSLQALTSRDTAEISAPWHHPAVPNDAIELSQPVPLPLAA